MRRGCTTVLLRHPYAGATYTLSDNRGLLARSPLSSLCGIEPPLCRQSFGYNRPLLPHSPQDRLSCLFAPSHDILRGSHPLHLLKPSIGCHDSSITYGHSTPCVCYNAGTMQSVPSQEQLTRIENRLQRVTELLELLVGKIAQQDEDIFAQLVHSDRFQEELQEAVRALKADPTQLTDLYEAYRQQKTA